MSSTTTTALVRAVITSALLWLVGALVVHGAFLTAGTSPSVQLADGTHRGHAVWIGAQCLVAAGALAAAAVLAFSTVDFSDPRAGRLRTLTAALALLLLVLAIVWTAHQLQALPVTLGIGLSGSAVIGTLAGLGLVWWRADPERRAIPDHRPSTAPVTGGRAWGSRGR